jgi:hypothetical protein
MTPWKRCYLTSFNDWIIRNNTYYSSRRIVIDGHRLYLSGYRNSWCIDYRMNTDANISAWNTDMT